MPPRKLLKGNRLAGLGTADQLALVVYIVVHRVRDSLVGDKRFMRWAIFLANRRLYCSSASR